MHWSEWQLQSLLASAARMGAASMRQHISQSAPLGRLAVYRCCELGAHKCILVRGEQRATATSTDAPPLLQLNASRSARQQRERRRQVHCAHCSPRCRRPVQLLFVGGVSVGRRIGVVLGTGKLNASTARERQSGKALLRSPIERTERRSALTTLQPAAAS